MTLQLILFDIDGTLLLTGGMSSRGMKHALQQTLGDVAWHKVTPGLIDPQLFEQQARTNNVADPMHFHDAYKRAYLDHLKQELHDHRDQVQLLPGVRELLEQLKQHHIAAAVVTGNYEDAAHMKLEAAGLTVADFAMVIGAEAGRDRAGLIRAAVQRYEKRRPADQPLSPQAVVMVGDTPHDVAAAKQAGVRSLAVATGWSDLATLQAAGPDMAVANLAEPGLLKRLLDRG